MLHFLLGHDAHLVDSVVLLQGTDIVERLWSRLGSWIMNKRQCRIVDVLSVVENMVFETKAKYDLGSTSRVGYVPTRKLYAR